MTCFRVVKFQDLQLQIGGAVAWEGTTVKLPAFRSKLRVQTEISTFSGMPSIQLKQLISSSEGDLTVHNLLVILILLTFVVWLSSETQDNESRQPTNPQL